MTCWLTEEHWETVLGLVTDWCIVVSDGMLISKQSILVKPLEMLCAVVVDALFLGCGVEGRVSCI